MTRYDKSNPDPRYHAEWARKFADRAIFGAVIAIALALIALALSLWG